MFVYNIPLVLLKAYGSLIDKIQYNIKPITWLGEHPSRGKQWICSLQSEVDSVGFRGFIGGWLSMCNSKPLFSPPQRAFGQNVSITHKEVTCRRTRGTRFSEPLALARHLLPQLHWSFHTPSCSHPSICQSLSCFWASLDDLEGGCQRLGLSVF